MHRAKFDQRTRGANWSMAANPCFVRLYRSNSTDPTSIWFALSIKLSHKPREFIVSDSFSFFKARHRRMSFYFHVLFDTNGGNVDPSWSSWFRSFRKKDTVIVATLFGIVWWALRRKNLDADEMQTFTLSFIRFDRSSSYFSAETSDSRKNVGVRR